MWWLCHLTRSCLLTLDHGHWGTGKERPEFPVMPLPAALPHCLPVGLWQQAVTYCPCECVAHQFHLLAISYQSSTKIKILNPAYGPSRVCGPPCSSWATQPPTIWVSATLVAFRSSTRHVPRQCRALHIPFPLTAMPSISSLLHQGKAPTLCPDLGPNIWSLGRTSLMPLAWLKALSWAFVAPCPSPL